MRGRGPRKEGRVLVETSWCGKLAHGTQTYKNINEIATASIPIYLQSPVPSCVLSSQHFPTTYRHHSPLTPHTRNLALSSQLSSAISAPNLPPSSSVAPHRSPNTHPSTTHSRARVRCSDWSLSTHGLAPPVHGAPQHTQSLFKSDDIDTTRLDGWWGWAGLLALRCAAAVLPAVTPLRVRCIRSTSHRRAEHVEKERVLRYLRVGSSWATRNELGGKSL